MILLYIEACTYPEAAPPYRTPPVSPSPMRIAVEENSAREEDTVIRLLLLLRSASREDRRVGRASWRSMVCV